MTKNERQKMIIEFINTREIETQHDLSVALEENGHKVTQATISRDVRELGLAKEFSLNGKNRYVLGTPPAHSDRISTIFKESVTEVAVAQNIVVLKTLPGLASGACMAIDGMEFDGVVGTLAGDDTAFLAMISNTAATRLREEIAARL